MLPNHLVAPGVRSVQVRRRGGRVEQDLVVVEEPLEIRVNGKPLVVTMRTPGHDEDLAAGFLWAEGVVTARDQLGGMCVTSGTTDSGTRIRVTAFSGDRIDVALTGKTDRRAVESAEREFRATAACGVCGKSKIDDLQQDLPPIASVEVDTAMLEQLPDRLRQAQELFDATGGIHAAGIFDLEGHLLCAREDIGRHNAVDKVIGHFVRHGGVPLTDRILVVSGRAGFELAQKALKAAVPVMVSVGATSSIAVSMAIEAGMTLYSFAAPGRGNLHVKG